MAFVPGARRAKRALEPFREGLSESLVGALAEWCRSHITDSDTVSLVNVEFGLDLSHFDAYSWDMDRDRVITYFRQRPEALMELVEYLVERRSSAASRARLEHLLEGAHSIFTVRLEEPGLAHRVDPAVQRQAEQVIDAADAGSAHWLTEAWNDAYARTPRPGPSYEASIKAVEAALRGIVIPDNGRGTLTQIINAIRDGRTKGKFAFELSDSRGEAAGANEPEIDTIDTVLAMLRALSYGQKTRHGKSGEVTVNTASEARVAAQLAVTLVQFGLSGALKRV